jgi:hypothetical protein
MVKKLLFLILIFSFFIFPKVIFAAPTISITSFPSSVTAGDEFNIEFSATGLNPSAQYSMKARGGNNLTEADTWNSAWLNDNDVWSSMPVFTSDPEGSASATLKARFGPTTLSGQKDLVIRIRGTTNYDSPAVSVSVTAATPTPTPTDTPTPTPNPTSPPTTTPTSTPVKTLTPTPKPTIELVTTDPTPEPEVQGVQDAQSGDSMNLLGTASASAATTDSGGPPVIPIILISCGGIFVVGAGLALAKKGKSEYNLKDENTSQTT